MIVGFFDKNWRGSLYLITALLAFFLVPLRILAGDSSLSGQQQLTGNSLSNSTNPSNSVTHHFKFKQKINPIWWMGNADEPVAPAWYQPGKHNRDLAWHMRNPFHNFDAYVIGISDKPFNRTGRFPQNVFNPNGGWNWAVCHYKVWQLPFVAYEHKGVSFYLGWRERGNFGIKLNLASRRHESSAVARKGTERDERSPQKGGG